MIDINLVPQQQRKKKQKSSVSTESKLNVPKEVVLGLGGGLVVLLLIVHVALQVIIFNKDSARKELEKQWQEILPSKTSVDKVITELRLLQNKFKAVEQIQQERNVLWAKKLNEVSDNVPRGVWLKRIAFDNNMLFIEGSAIAKGQDEMINVHRFASNLKEQEGFLSNLVNFELGSIQRRKIKTVEIADFTIKAELK